MAHDLSQELGPGQHGLFAGACGNPFGVIRGDGGRVDEAVDVVRDIGGGLGTGNLRAQGRQVFCDRGGRPVGAGNREVTVQQDLSQTAHADAADANEMDMYRLRKVNLKHRAPLL